VALWVTTFLWGDYLTSLLFASSIFGATYISIAVLGITMQELNTYSAYKSQKIDRNFPTGTKDTTLSLLSLALFSASMNISGTNQHLRANYANFNLSHRINIQGWGCMGAGRGDLQISAYPWIG